MSSAISNIRSTFTRGEKKDTVLEYDDSAFNFFVCAVTFVIALPWTLIILKRLFLGGSNKPLSGVNCGCESCKKTQDKYRQRERIGETKTPLFLQLVVLGIIWYLFFTAMSNIEVQGDIKKFEPFHILNVTETATDDEIKTAYRTLARKYHPDKNKDNSEAAVMFILIQKAYDCLMDDTARRNYRKYGNPDGPGSWSVFIALPKWLIREENKMLVLCVFLVVLILAVPLFMLYYHQKASRYSMAHGVLHENDRIFYTILSENATLKQFPQILAMSKEFGEGITQSQGDETRNELTRLKKRLIGEVPKPKHEHPLLYKLILLILAHLFRYDLTAESHRKDQKYILKITPRIMTFMAEFIINLPTPEMDRRMKKMGLNLLLRIIEFTQLMMQGLWIKDSPFLQLPHFSLSAFTTFQRKNKKITSNFREFLQMEREVRTKYLNPQFNTQEIMNINGCCDMLPRMTLDVDFKVEDVSEICAGDYVNFEFHITRTHLLKGQKTGFIHSAAYPFPKLEVWWLIVGNPEKNSVIYYEKITTLKSEITKKWNQIFPKEGKFRFSVNLKCDSYKGVDVETSFDVFVKPKIEIEEAEKEESSEDEGPGMMDQLHSMMNPSIAQDEELEESEEEEEVEEAPDKKMNAREKKSERQRKIKEERKLNKPKKG